MYATYEEMLNIIGHDEMVTLTDHQDTGAPVQSVAQEALNDACSTIDGHLSSRYDLPLSIRPDVLRRPAIDIAVYNLASSHSALTDDIKDRSKIAIRFVERIGEGKAGLGKDEPKSTIPDGANGSDAVMFDAPPDKIMTRDRLKGM